MDALNGVRARCDARQTKRRGLVYHALRYVVDEHFDAIHVGLDDQRSEFGRRLRRGLRAPGIVGKEHLRIEAAALRCRILPPAW